MLPALFSIYDLTIDDRQNKTFDVEVIFASILLFFPFFVPRT